MHCLHPTPPETWRMLVRYLVLNGDSSINSLIGRCVNYLRLAIQV